MSFWKSLPKAELHFHFEGAVEHPGVPNGHSTEIRNFDDLIEAVRVRIASLQSPRDIERAGTCIARRLEDDGVVYAEIYLSSGSLLRSNGIAVEDGLCAAHQGLSTSRNLHHALIIDLVRHHGPEVGEQILAAAVGLIDRLPIVAIGLSGYEDSYPASAYSGLFEKARSLGLRCVAHAGEGCSSRAVLEALQDLRVDRVGHGVAAVHDEQLMKMLSVGDVPLEICLTSNLASGVVSDIKEHPLPSLIAAGVPVVLSSDDPSVLSTSLSLEFDAAESIGIEREVLIKLARNAFAKAFLESREQKILMERFDRDLEALMP